jgi:hypothetical protein
MTASLLGSWRGGGSKQLLRCKGQKRGYAKTLSVEDGGFEEELT